MATEPATLPADLKVAYCRFCQKSRTRADMRPTRTAKGAVIHRCVECVHRTLKPAKRPGSAR